MDSTDKKTKNHLRDLSSELGRAWDYPTSPRRQTQASSSASPVPTGPAQQPSSTLPSRSSPHPQSRPGTPDRPVASIPGDQRLLAGGKLVKSASISKTPGPKQRPTKATHGLPSKAAMSSRGNQRRGPNRNTELSEHGEEVAAWKEVKDKLSGIVDAVNQSSANMAEMHEQDKLCAEKKKKNTLHSDDLNKLDQLSRQGVKSNESALAAIRDQIERIKVLRAVVKHNEETQEANATRLTGRRADVRGDVYDFDQADSPGPSPNHPSNSRRHGVGGGGDRGDSMPPKPRERPTTATKAGSAEPQPGPAATAMRAKPFAKGDEVAFKPKLVGSEQTDWILGIVQSVVRESKARQYIVLDADFDENHHQKDFKTSASSMILIPKEGTVLPPLEEGRVVLALYPNTTTFYKAEVIGMDGTEKVNLKFEGEESSNTMQAVTRRHVVEYRV